MVSSVGESDSARSDRCCLEFGSGDLLWVLDMGFYLSFRVEHSADFVCKPVATES